MRVLSSLPCPPLRSVARRARRDHLRYQYLIVADPVDGGKQVRALSSVSHVAISRMIVRIEPTADECRQLAFQQDKCSLATLNTWQADSG